MADYTGTITLTDMSTLPIPERNYFWFLTQSEGTCDPGIYVTETDINSFKQQKAGAYLYINNGGLNLGVDNTIYTELTTGGLKIKKGGIVGGDVNTNNYIYLSTEPHTGTAVTIGGNSSNWKLIVGTKFGVTGAGDLYATNANIQGIVNATSGSFSGTITTSNITATGGKIGGFAIDSTSIHTNGVAVTSNADNSIALSSADFTRTINGTSRAGLRFAIGNKLGVTGDGVIYASGVNLTGTITATSGTIGGFNITSSSNTGTSANGGHCYTSSLYAHSGDGTYEYEVGLKGDGNNTTGDSGNLAFYVKRITKGGSWSSASNIFYITKGGAIHAQSGTVAGWLINSTQISGYTTGSASTDSSSSALRWALIQRSGADGNVAFGVASRATTSDSWIWRSYMTYGGTLVGTNLQVKDSNNKKRVQIDANGMKVYHTDGSTVVGSFGSSISLNDTAGTNRFYADTTGVRVGPLVDNKMNILISGSDNASVQIRKKSTVLAEFNSSAVTFKNTSGATIASFGSTVTLGNTTSNDVYMKINSGNIQIFDRRANEQSICLNGNHSYTDPYIDVGLDQINAGIHCRLYSDRLLKVELIYLLHLLQLHIHKLILLFGTKEVIIMILFLLDHQAHPFAIKKILKM